MMLSRNKEKLPLMHASKSVGRLVCLNIDNILFRNTIATPVAAVDARAVT